MFKRNVLVKSIILINSKFSPLLLLICMSYLFLCPLDETWCSLPSRHPLLCFGSVSFLIHRELFPSVSNTNLGTMVNGEYGSDAAIGWTSVATIFSLIAAVLLYLKQKEKEPLVLAAPLICHWICLYIFFNLMMDRSAR